jgi:hypothetical protein
MKISFLLSSIAIGSASAFSVQPVKPIVQRSHVTLSAKKASGDEGSWGDQLGKVVATGLVTASLWAAPAMIQNPSYVDAGGPQIFSSSVANAKQMASATGSRVNKDPESLLRYGLPINSKEVRVEIGQN